MINNKQLIARLIENGDSIEEIAALLKISPSELMDYFEGDSEGNAYHNKGAYDQAIADRKRYFEIKE